MDLHGQINAASESRPGHPQPCHWSVWIVLECGFHVKLQNGFQFLRDCAGFWQIQSHTYYDTTSYEATCKIIILLHEIIFCTSEIITATNHWLIKL